MINPKDVIRMKIPYPNISDKLAVSAHMYICKNVKDNVYEYVKCQTLKPKMLTSKILKHFIDEEADILRNPFQKATRIDCDKLFVTSSVQYDDGLKTITRPDVCQELYDIVMKELDEDGNEEIELVEDELISLNSMIKKV